MWLTSLFTLRNFLRGVGGLLGAVGASLLVYGPITETTAPFIVAALAVGTVVVVGTYVSDSRTRSEAVRFATQSGWTFEEQRSGMFSRLRTPPFHSADASYTHVVSGKFGGFECFDGIYEWRIRIDKDAKISGRHRVAAVRMDDELPRVMLIPEGLTARVVKAFGGADREFESSTFNRNWRILADDPKVAHEMLSPRVMERLDAMSIKAPLLFEKGFGVRIDSDTAGIASLADRLGGILAVAKFLPQHTIEDHGRLANSIGPLPSVATPGALIGGYNPAMIAQDEEFLRTAKPRKHQKWLNAARAGKTPGATPLEDVASEPDAR